MNYGRIGVLGWIAASVMPLLAQPLFEAARGTLPSDQGWIYFAARKVAEQTHTGPAARLDTTADVLESAGYALVTPVALSRDRGFNVGLRIRLNAESHSRPDRAGFSLIVLAEDRWGIELGFWTNLVFAQASDPLFVHAEDSLFDFTSRFTDLVLSVNRAHYTLFADRAPLLSGPVRDYSAFTGFPDVYETPNFLFLGDNTTSAAADVEIAAVTQVAAPVLRLLAPDRIEWDGIPGHRYTVESSPDLGQWTVEAVVHSATTLLTHTNITGVGESRFLRVSHP